MSSREKHVVSDERSKRRKLNSVAGKPPRIGWQEALRSSIHSSTLWCPRKKCTIPQREQFLIDQGYSFKVITSLPSADAGAELSYYSLDEQMSLLTIDVYVVEVVRRKSSTSSPVEMTSLPREISTAEVMSQKKRKRRKIEWGNTSDGDVEWTKSLSECQLDLMVSVKQLAMERVLSTREKSLNGLLTPAGLRVIGIILEEFMMDRVQALRNASTAPSSVIDDLRACIEKSEVETNETKGTNQDEGS